MNRRDMLLVGGALVLGMLIVGRRSSARPQRVPNRRADWGTFNPRPLRVTVAGQNADGRLKVESVTINDAPDISLEGVSVEASRFDALLEQHFATDPVAGKFYQIGPNDTPETIARAALTAIGEHTNRQILDYVFCFTSSPWNLERYGSPSTSKRFPKKWIIPGFGQGLRAAFLPRNADAVAMMGDGLIPPRTVDDKAVAQTEAESYGVIWLPPVSPEQLAIGIVTCGPFSWDDGTSTINPDPELTELLEAA